MVTFRSNNNNNRRPTFRSNNNRRPPFRRNDESSKFSNNDNFQRKTPGRNNHNASKLIEKYNELAREALAKEDRVLSESYFQYADHFTRIQNDQESDRIARMNLSSAEVTKSVTKEDESVKPNEAEEIKKPTPKIEVKKIIKTTEKKTATS